MDISVLIRSCTNGFSEMVSQGDSAMITFLFNRSIWKLLGNQREYVGGGIGRLYYQK
ncbi:MAG: hypothetical protein HFI05_02830 [Lachnospiraceae bacterium]|jgi:hypothetical protein|nr:hypothetical protein [Lachnospiraceae bacterium]